MAQTERVQQPKVLTPTSDLTREQWLEFRRKGIGGSDAASVLGISPFRTGVDLYYDKIGLPVEDGEENWVAMEVGTQLEDLVARIFEKKTGLRVIPVKFMLQHAEHPFMLADIDRMVMLPGGGNAILECKTTNYNARDKWEYDGKPIVPEYYEAQGRHYMAVMNLDRVYYCCLYGNNEDEVIIRHIDRDKEYEAELIALEENFWMNHVQAKVPPPYVERDGGLILDSLLRRLGPSYKNMPPVALTEAQFEKVRRYVELKKEKGALNASVKALDAEMERLKALIVADMGESWSAAYEDEGGSYTVTFKPSYSEGILKDNLLRLKDAHPDIYAEYATTSESRRFNVKFAAAKAA